MCLFTLCLLHIIFLHIILISLLPLLVPLLQSAETNSLETARFTAVLSVSFSPPLRFSLYFSISSPPYPCAWLSLIHCMGTLQTKKARKRGELVLGRAPSSSLSFNSIFYSPLPSRPSPKHYLPLCITHIFIYRFRQRQPQARSGFLVDTLQEVPYRYHQGRR